MNKIFLNDKMMLLNHHKFLLVNKIAEMRETESNCKKSVVVNSKNSMMFFCPFGIIIWITVWFIFITYSHRFIVKTFTAHMRWKILPG